MIVPGMGNRVTNADRAYKSVTLLSRIRIYPLLWPPPAAYLWITSDALKRSTPESPHLTDLFWLAQAVVSPWATSSKVVYNYNQYRYEMASLVAGR